MKMQECRYTDHLRVYYEDAGGQIYRLPTAEGVWTLRLLLDLMVVHILG